ncbi:hypothetical protein BBC0178_014670 [Bartonella apihabitans]|uniref:Uncharacterized protein n=1 Tax=Bartonella apihabitans TaxID=2750929 RepID=A0A1U9MBS6_9HYPH|nr:hypothetical protein BBC0178_014670 [Bartonella apihabitans]AQT45170.1 hypothetical protein BBC0244_014780 [Bartonella apihabitans]
MPQQWKQAALGSTPSFESACKGGLLLISLSIFRETVQSLNDPALIEERKSVVLPIAF